MSGLRRLKSKIKGVEFVEKVTTAMRFTSQAEVMRFLPYFTALNVRFQVENSMVTQAWSAFGGDVFLPRYLNPKLGAPAIYVVFGPERGFCGAMTDSIVSETIRHVGAQDKLWVVGHGVIKGLRHRQQTVHLNFGTREESMNAVAQLLIKELTAARAEHVTVIYPHFHSLLSWELRVEQVMPFSFMQDKDASISLDEDPIDFWDYLGERYLKRQLHFMRAHAQMSECSARMVAMDQASKNAEELVSELRMDWQRCRQDLVTRELLEVTAGAVALEEV